MQNALSRKPGGVFPSVGGGVINLGAVESGSVVKPPGHEHFAGREQRRGMEPTPLVHRRHGRTLCHSFGRDRPKLHDARRHQSCDKCRLPAIPPGVPAMISCQWFSAAAVASRPDLTCPDTTHQSWGNSPLTCWAAKVRGTGSVVSHVGITNCQSRVWGYSMNAIVTNKSIGPFRGRAWHFRSAASSTANNHHQPLLAANGGLRPTHP